MYIQRVYKFLKKTQTNEKNYSHYLLVGACALVNAQLTYYVGNDALDFYLQDKALVYSGGGVKNRRNC